MVHNKNKLSKLPAKPSDSWISSDLWLEIAFSKVIYHSISKIVEYVPFKCYKLQHHQVSIYIIPIYI